MIQPTSKMFLYSFSLIKKIIDGLLMCLCHGSVIPLFYNWDASLSACVHVLVYVLYGEVQMGGSPRDEDEKDRQELEPRLTYFSTL